MPITSNSLDTEQLESMRKSGHLIWRQSWEDRTELTGAGFGDARDKVAKTAQIKENDNRDFAGETTDTIREYLTAIGQHPLLSKADEIRLGLAVERRMELKQRRQAFEEEHGYPPLTAELVADIYRGAE